MFHQVAVLVYQGVTPPEQRYPGITVVITVFNMSMHAQRVRRRHGHYFSAAVWLCL